MRKAPRAIAQEIAGAFGSLDGIRQVAAAPNGYLNVFLERRDFLLARLSDASAAAPPSAAKAIVEHTAINPNKAAHIGHLRNSALGDTLVRVLRFQGIPVEVQNYIDDTGVQVADVVVGVRVLEGKSLDQIRQTAETTRFDYYCWDLYARVTEWYEEDKARLDTRARTLHDIEHGGNDNAEIAAFIADRIVRCHLQTMARMNVDYDLLTWEGDILRLKFWAQAFDVLKAKKAVYLATEGRLAGCWVMPIQEDLENPKAQIPHPESQESEPEEEREKVIVRSNGVVTYVGKDIAYQFWKLGLLGKDFHYRVFSQKALTPGPLWATCTTGGEGLASLLVRDGGAVARDRSRAWLCAAARCRGREAAVRRGVRPQGNRRQGRRSARYARSLRGHRSGHPQSGARRAGASAHRGNDCDRGGPLLHGEILARQGHRLRPGRGAELRGRKRSLYPVRGRPREQHLSEGSAARRAR
ncbi:MAG: arginine--tRNA ligase [Acidobacteria bacterium]|nr:MAG: arginine--tRNA ligase [Acidobacteriota bacterium]